MKTETRFEFKASRDGKFVVFTATQTNEKPISLNIPTDVIDQMVVGLLGISVACAQLNPPTQPPFSGGNDQPELAFVQANGVAQDVTDRPDVVALTFLFGQTQVDIGMSREALQPLGSALLAATADRSQPQ